jgi:hypothetical protein
MTTTNDFDRTLAAWLNEDAVRMPDRPVELAIEHARSHPRRPDPLRFLRADPMPAPRTGVSLRAVLVMATVALLTVALAALAVLANRPTDSVVPVPSPSTSSAPSSSPIPSASPSASPRTLSVKVVNETGLSNTVAISDASGLLVDAASGQAKATDDPGDTVSVVQDGPAALRLAWVNCPSDTGNRLTIDTNLRAFVFERGACAGDTMAIVNVLVLTFSQPVDASTISVTLSTSTP